MKVECVYCGLGENTSGGPNRVVRFGYFVRASDASVVQRFYCQSCKKSFSRATFGLCYRQHKRHLNKNLGGLLVSGVSQRRAAVLLSINRKTVVRKFIFLGLLAQKYLLEKNLEKPKCKIVEFDDLESFEHTKLKPLSVTIAVEHQTRRILGFMVAQMPAKGHLSQKSVKKYGRRKDKRPFARKALFKQITPMIENGALIKSDENPHYVRDVKRYFPASKHQTFKSRKGCIVGQGELKKLKFDPLFSLNHTYAMFRANINRLFRKTWCTTKIPQRLAYHMALYAVFHNGNLKN